MWGVNELDWYTVRIKVWIDGNKRIPWFEMQKKFDDPWINFQEVSKGELVSNEEDSTPVTPSLVAAYIQEVKRKGWVANTNEPIFLKTNSSGGLEETNS